MKISIVTLTYGHESYIKQAIEGVLMQEGDFEIELIISNDNSPDNTDTLIRNIINTDPRAAAIIKYTKHITNLGAMANFIWALKQCKGQYTALCDGDDYWTDPLKLQKQVDFLEDNCNYGMSFTACDRYYQEQDVYIEANAEKKNREVLTFESLLFSNPIRTCTTVIRGSLVKQFVRLMGSKILKLKMGDAPLWLFISMNHKIKYHNDRTAVYRILEKSATNVSAYKKLLFRMSRYKVSWFFLQKRFSFPIATKLSKAFLKETPILIIKTILSFLNLYKPNKEKVINRYN